MGAWGTGIFANDTACDFELDVRVVLKTVNSELEEFLDRVMMILGTTNDLTNGERDSEEANDTKAYVKDLITGKNDAELLKKASKFEHFEDYKKLAFDLLEVKDNPALLIERILKEYNESEPRKYNRNDYSLAAIELQMETGKITDYVKEMALYWVENERVSWFREEARKERKQILQNLKNKVLTF